MEGVIHGSKTNQPPRFTPRTFSPPKLNFKVSSRLTLDIMPAGRAWLKVERRATAATAELKMCENTMLAGGYWCNLLDLECDGAWLVMLAMKAIHWVGWRIDSRVQAEGTDGLDQYEATVAAGPAYLLNQHTFQTVPLHQQRDEV